MDGCGIEKIHAGAFSELVSMTKLDLSDNLLKLENICNFSNLTSLRQLYLTRNRIDFNKEGQFNPFSDLHDLIILDLSFNEIRWIDKQVFQSMNGLGLLNLTSNYVQPWEDRIFFNFSADFVVQIVDNRLTEVTAAMLEDFAQVKVAMAENPLRCSCELKTFYEFATSENTSIVDWSTRTFVCQEDNKEQPLGEFNFDVACNRKSFVKSTVYIAIGVCVAILASTSAVVYWKRWHVKLLIIKFRAFFRKSDENSDGSREFDAFVSYCEEDRQWVFDVFVPKVEKEKNYHVCLHERDFQVGKDIEENIVAAMEKSSNIVLLVSRSFVESKWCQYEVNFAHRQLLCPSSEKKVIVVLLDPVSELNATRKVPGTLKYFLRSRTYLEWTGDQAKNELFWERLFATLPCRDQA